MKIIEAKNLSKEINNEGQKCNILHSNWIDISKGEFVAIMGPSGSGKSTLLNILGVFITGRTFDGLIDIFL